MIKEIQDLSPTRKRILIEIPAEVLEGEIKTTLGVYREKAKFDGFRPGKAPLSLVEKRYGREAEAESLERVVSKAYGDVLDSAKIRPVARPDVEGLSSFKRNEALGLTITVDVRGEIPELKYEGLEVTELPVDIADKDVDETLERLREERAAYEPTEAGGAEGDLVMMDYEAVGHEGKSFKDEIFRLGSPAMPPAFSDALKGKTKGQELEYEVDFPADFYAPEFAGKKVNFKASIKEVRARHLPELDAELAKSLGFDSIEALRARVRERLSASKTSNIKRLQKSEVLRKLIDNHKFDVADSLVNAEVDNLVAQALHQAQSQGGAAPEEAKLRIEMRDNAVRHVKAGMLLEVIGEKENIAITEDDMKAEIIGIAARTGMTPENVVKYYMARDGSAESLRQSVLEDKTMDLLLSKAKFVAPAAAEATK